MSQAIQDFINYWKCCATDKAPFVHPEDKALLREGDFELRLLPMPINGSLKEAEVFILMLNPGLDEGDYSWEKKRKFRNGLLQNLTQKHIRDCYPLLYLDPAFAQSGGAGYWIRSRPGKRGSQKLRWVTEALAGKCAMSVEEMKQYISRKVAIVQLCPYHSCKKPSDRLLRELPSCEQARQFVKKLSKEGEKLIIVPRAVRHWGLLDTIRTSKLVVYPNSLGASASLTPLSAGGAAIIRQLSKAIKGST